MRQRQVVLILGVPRSGSTWLTDILSSAADTDLVMEPDNEKTSVLASFLKQDIARFPQLGVNDEGPRNLQTLWDCAFASNWAPLLSRGRVASAVCRVRKASQESAIEAKPADAPAVADKAAMHAVFRALCETRLGPFRPHRVIKSVHAVLYPEWIVQRCKPRHTLIIMRHPLAVLQSWRRMKMPDAFRLSAGAAGAALPQQDGFVKMAEQLCRMYAALREATDRNPAWEVVWHETLCADPGGQMRAIAERCGIAWSAAMEARLMQMNTSGQGYKPQRDAAAEIGKWKGEVSDAEAAAAHNVFVAAGLQEYFQFDTG